MHTLLQHWSQTSSTAFEQQKSRQPPITDIAISTMPYEIWLSTIYLANTSIQQTHSPEHGDTWPHWSICSSSDRWPTSYWKMRNEFTLCNDLLLYNTHTVVIKPYTMEHTSTTSGNATVPRACPMVYVVARDFLTHTNEFPEMFNMLQES